MLTGQFLLPIVERGECFHSAASVSCLFVCQHGNFRMIKRRMILNLTVRCIAQKSCPSSNFKVKGQKSRSPGTKKRKCAAFCSGVVLWGAILVRHFFRSGPRGRGPLCPWENQRMLSSFTWVLRDLIQYLGATVDSMPWGYSKRLWMVLLSLSFCMCFVLSECVRF